MTTAEQLETIDRLRTGAHPGGHGGSRGDRDGPGHHLVELGRTQDFWEGDGSDRAGAADQIDAECTALVQALTDRWGRPDVFSPATVHERVVAGEEIPEPWGEISASTDLVNLWRAGEHWLAVYVIDAGSPHPYLLMAALTTADPP
ncbi:hypothetical protein [Streptomyces sp. NPDC093225]|uniref:hypothetical protein n=1 Tax=Streptomyces sp. NPDC093225 TaxID=3366034 RepID=UPI00380D9FE4